MIENIFIHCSATRPKWGEGRNLSWKVAEITLWHKERGFKDIGYHYIIDRDGKIAKGRNEDEMGAHAKGWNKHSIGICLIGGFGSNADDKFLDNYTKEQEDTLVKKIKELQEKYQNTMIYGHNEVSAKACPGFNAKDWWRNAKDVEERSVGGTTSGTNWVDMLMGILRKLLSR